MMLILSFVILNVNHSLQYRKHTLHTLNLLIFIAVLQKHSALSVPAIFESGGGMTVYVYKTVLVRRMWSFSAF